MASLQHPARPVQAKPVTLTVPTQMYRPLDLRIWTPPVRAPGRLAEVSTAAPVPRASDERAYSLAGADRATQVRVAARLHQTGELGAALRRGEPGLADAVAAALHDGAIAAPHPVDRWRANVRGLAADLTTMGLGLGRTAAHWLGTTPMAPVGQRALAVADAWTGGAARAWSERARGWADGVARRAMALHDGAAAPRAEDEADAISDASHTWWERRLRTHLPLSKRSISSIGDDNTLLIDELYGEGLATRTDPELCAGSRKGQAKR
jgi:hypothetical protein